MSEAEIDALEQYLLAHPNCALEQILCAHRSTVTRWARIRLPNGQIARSLFAEKYWSNPRVAHNVKVSANAIPVVPLLDHWIIENGKLLFGEVQYYFQCTLNDFGDQVTLATVHLYSAPDQDLLRMTTNTLWSCCLEDTYHIFEVKSIQSAVAMCLHSTTFLGDEWVEGKKRMMNLRKRMVIVSNSVLPV